MFPKTLKIGYKALDPLQTSKVFAQLFCGLQEWQEALLERPMRSEFSFPLFISS